MMGKLKMLQHSPQWRRAGNLSLAACWLIGVLLGFCAAFSIRTILAQSIFDATAMDASICRIFFVSCFPLLLCALFMSVGEHGVCLVICFLKAFGFGVIACGVGFAYGSAGWLVRLLLMFSSLMTIPALYLFCARGCSAKAGFQYKIFLFAILYSAGIGITDIFVISPFLRLLIG